MTRTATISPEARVVLEKLTYSGDGTTVAIPAGQLDRKLYLAVNEVLEAAGGKWNRKLKVHVFESDAREKIQAMLGTGVVKNEAKDANYFPTPLPLVRELIRLAEVRPGHLVLEPSAGRGAIVTELLALGTLIDACELLESNRKALEALLMDEVQKRPLRGRALRILGSDFSTFDFGLQRYDRVVMNPPFALEIEHVRKAHGLLLPGGILVSVMSAGIEFRSDRKTKAFRTFVAEHNGTVQANPDGSFRESGTGVRTVTVRIPAQEET